MYAIQVNDPITQGAHGGVIAERLGKQGRGDAMQHTPWRRPEVVPGGLAKDGAQRPVRMIVGRGARACPRCPRAP